MIASKSIFNLLEAIQQNHNKMKEFQKISTHNYLWHFAFILHFHFIVKLYTVSIIDQTMTTFLSKMKIKSHFTKDCK